MVPRSIIAAALVAIMAIPAMAQNFITFQRGSEEARSREILQRAERCRKDIAIAWFGEELSGWQTPCVITWKVDKSRGAGVTTYARRFGSIGTMDMKVSGTWDRLMNDVIPHEVFHLVARERLGFSMARWMDEGAASTAESDDALTFWDNRLEQYLSTRRGIPLNQMMVATEYPRDVQPFYAQSASLSRFLLAKGGAAKFIELAKEHNRSRSWTKSVDAVYGYKSITAMQKDWLKWVRSGSPPNQSLAKPVARMKAVPRSEAPYRPTDTLRDDRAMKDALRLDGPQNGLTLTGQHCEPGVPTPALPITPPTSGTPGSSVKIQIDYAKLAAELAKFPQLKGEPGKNGKDGRDGTDGTNGRDGAPGKPGASGQVSPEQIQEIVEQLAARIPQPPNEQEIVERVVSALKKDNLVCSCKGTDTPSGPEPDEPTSPPDTDSGPDDVPPVPPGSIKPNRVLYFTSQGCTTCAPLDNAIERYKRNGWPITIITLRERDAEVYQVPQIFVPETDERAVGWQEVNAFLYTYLEGGQSK